MPSALVNRDDLIFGSGYVTHNSGQFRFAEGGISAKFKVSERDTTLDEFGRFDAVHTDRMVVVSGKLWAGWENLALIFPSYFVAPVVGSRLKAVSAADLPLQINGANGDRMIVHNAMLTKMGNLFLGVNEDFFTADVEWTGLLRKDYDPSEASAYFTLTSAESYPTPDALVRGNFRAPVVKATWTGGTAGNTKPGKFATGFMTNKGWRLDFNPELSNEATKVDGLGTLNYTIKDFSATAKAMPIGPTLAEISAELRVQEFALGARTSVNAADLLLSVANVATETPDLHISLFNCAIQSEGSGFDFAREKNRIAEVTWKTLPDQTDPAAARVSVS